MLTFKTATLAHNGVGSSGTDEHKLQISFQPLRLYTNQETVEFLRAFFASASEPGDANQSDPVCQDEDHRSRIFFSSFDVRSCKLKIDFDTRSVNLQALQKGNLMELLNLFPLEGVELEIQRVHLNGIHTLSSLMERIGESWLQDITSSQLHKSVAGHKLLRPLSAVGSEAANLIILPVRQYQKDGRIIHGLRKGAGALLRTITIETIHTSQKVSRYVASALDDLVSPQSCLSGSNTSASRSSHSQPDDIQAGLKHARESLSRGVNAAAHAIIAIPIREYQAQGPKGAMKAVIRAVPIAILRPVAGASDALAYTLLGIRNTMEPSLRRDEELRYASCVGAEGGVP